MAEVTPDIDPAALTQETAGHPTVADARPLVLLRYRPGTASETARTVHLAPLPTGATTAVSALCGALLHPDQVETVTPGHGMPCTRCVLSHVVTDDSPTTEDPTTAPALPSQDSADTTPLIAATCYQAWGWPATLRHDQVCLDLGDAVALIIPLPLAPQVTALLRQRRCPPAVLAHPYAPEHQVLLAGERYGVSLPWPPGVHRVIGTLLLPPTMTPRGPITWTHPPEPTALQLCREIDVAAAVRTALSGLPPSSGPAHS